MWHTPVGACPRCSPATCAGPAKLSHSPSKHSTSAPLPSHAVRQGDRTLRSVRLDASAAATLRISQARRAVVLKATDEHKRLVVRLQRHEWRPAMRLLSRAVTEAACGCRLWSQQGSGLLRPALLPGAAAALAAAALAAAHQPAQEAGSEGGEGSSVDPAPAHEAEPAAEAGQQAPASPAKRLHGLRITAPAECLTTQPPPAPSHGEGSAGPLAGAAQ